MNGEIKKYSLYRQKQSPVQQWRTDESESVLTVQRIILLDLGNNIWPSFLSTTFFFYLTRTIWLWTTVENENEGSNSETTLCCFSLLINEHTFFNLNHPSNKFVFWCAISVIVSQGRLCGYRLLVLLHILWWDIQYVATNKCQACRCPSFSFDHEHEKNIDGQHGYNISEQCCPSFVQLWLIDSEKQWGLHVVCWRELMHQ